MSKGNLTGEAARKNNFRSDPAVLSGSAALADYKGSGYDRGHLCPAGDMTFSEEAMSESFYMSNMSPQEPGFNRGIWKKIESQVRDWAMEEGDVIVVTGPVFQENKGSIGPNEVTVPGYYFKVVYDVTGDQKMIGFVLPNEKGDKELKEYAVSVDDIEALTGIDFFPQMMAEKQEEALESLVSLAEWGLAPMDLSSSASAAASGGEDSGSDTRLLMMIMFGIIIVLVVYRLLARKKGGTA